MTTTRKKKKDATTIRYERYKAVIDTLITAESFDLDEVQESCRHETVRFIKRVLRQLQKKGWLLKEEAEDLKEPDAYRWNQSRGEFCATKWLDEIIFGSQITVSPEQERPRERLLTIGAEKLKTSELIAILVRSGRPGESAVMAGQKVAREFQNKLERLPDAGRAELKAISCAVEKTAFCQIMAGIELGRRVALLSDKTLTTKISSSQEAISFCQRHFHRLITDAKQEEFHVVTLDTKNQVIDTHQVTIGTLDASLVHPREVFRPAIKDAASSVILVHNHPSGDPTPSREDHAATDRLTESGKLLGIDVLDHIVLGRKSSVSIRETE